MIYTPVHQKNQQKGIATLEVLIAMTLIATVISSVLPLVAGNQNASIGSQTNQEALYKAQALLEEQKANSYVDYGFVNSVGAAVDDIYTTSVDVENYPTSSDFFTKKVTSNATWKCANGQDLAVHLTTLVTNPDEINGGNTCNSSLSGDWTKPIFVNEDSSKTGY